MVVRKVKRVVLQVSGDGVDGAPAWVVAWERVWDGIDFDVGMWALCCLVVVTLGVGLIWLALWLVSVSLLASGFSCSNLTFSFSGLAASNFVRFFLHF